MVPVNIQKMKIQKLELNKWIVLTPKLVVINQKCGNNNEKIPIQGSFLIELNSQCELKIDNIIIKNFENSKKKFKNIALPRINFDHPVYKTTKNFEPIKLDNINLNELSAVKSALEIQKQKVDSIEINPIHFNNISGWTILIYILIILTIIFFVIKFYSHKCRQPKKQEAGDPPKVLFSCTTKNSEPNPRILH